MCKYGQGFRLSLKLILMNLVWPVGGGGSSRHASVVPALRERTITQRHVMLQGVMSDGLVLGMGSDNLLS